MTVEQLGAIAGVILSLAVAYIPLFANWYNQFDQAGKARVMGALLVVSALGVFGLGCANLFDFVPCTVPGAIDLLGVLIAALAANQATFLLLVKPLKRAG
jgi:hypothetical protein